MINKENIEYKIFEFHEGDLSAAEQQEVLDFIQVHPEYQTDFEAMQQSRVEEEDYTYAFAEELLVKGGTAGSRFLKWGLSGGLLLLGLVSYGLFTRIQSNGELNANNGEQLVAEETSNSSTQNFEVATSSNQNQTVVLKDNSKENNEIESNNYDEFKAPISTSTNLPSGQGPLKNNAVVSKDAESTAGGALKPYNDGVVAASSNPSVAEINRFVQEAIESEKHGEFAILEILIKSQNQVAKASDIKGVKERFKYDPLGLNGLIFSNDKDPIYANLEGTLLSLNPSFVGNSEGVRVEYYYRSEWPTINQGTYLSQMVSIDTYVEALRGGIGVVYEDDIVGHNKYNGRTIGMAYSPKFEVGKMSLEPSVRYIHSSRSVQWGQVSTNRMVDPRSGFTLAELQSDADLTGSSTNSTFHNIGLGFLVNHEKFFAGLSVDQLNNATYSFQGVAKDIQANQTYTAQFGTEIRKGIDSKFIYRPSVHLYKEGSWQSAWLMNQVSISNLLIGAGVSLNNAYLMQLGYDNRRVRFTYSYNLSTPPLGSDQLYGSHQLTMRLNFLPTKK
jgi:type IX secretion system PorP/SprF family membrane protein